MLTFGLSDAGRCLLMGSRSLTFSKPLTVQINKINHRGHTTVNTKASECQIIYTVYNSMLKELVCVNILLAQTDIVWWKYTQLNAPSTKNLDTRKSPSSVSYIFSLSLVSKAIFHGYKGLIKCSTVLLVSRIYSRPVTNSNRNILMLFYTPSYMFMFSL